MKKGYIKITDVLIKQLWSDIYVIFKHFRPTHIELRHWENDIWYFYGESELFDELKEGEVVPQYECCFTKLNDGTISYQFDRVK